MGYWDEHGDGNPPEERKIQYRAFWEGQVPGRMNKSEEQILQYITIVNQNQFAADPEYCLDLARKEGYLAGNVVLGSAWPMMKPIYDDFRRGHKILPASVVDAYVRTAADGLGNIEVPHEALFSLTGYCTKIMHSYILHQAPISSSWTLQQPADPKSDTALQKIHYRARGQWVSEAALKSLAETPLPADEAS